MSSLRALQYLTPDQVQKIRNVIADETETREKRADAVLLLRMHLSLNGHIVSDSGRNS